MLKKFSMTRRKWRVTRAKKAAAPPDAAALSLPYRQDQATWTTSSGSRST